jgi:hypothetical protein
MMCDARLSLKIRMLLHVGMCAASSAGRNVCPSGMNVRFAGGKYHPTHCGNCLWGDNSLH